jgi:FtsP/CotA-like multicopper oxidase with cupredoxin domain
VLSRDGRTRAATDQGIKDTVLVQEHVELLIRFTQPGFRVPFVFHCHTLEHEDAGMMGTISDGVNCLLADTANALQDGVASS